LRRKKRHLLIAGLVVVCVAAASLWWWRRTHSSALLLANARIALERDDPVQAARLARTVAERAPDSYDALQILAQSLIRLGQYEQVRRTADRAQRLRPESPEATGWKVRAYRGEAMLQLGRDPDHAQASDVDRAVETLDAALAVAKNVPAEWERSADLATERGLTYSAVAECHRIVQTRALQLENIAATSGKQPEAERYAQDAQKQAAAVHAAEDQAIESLEYAVESPRPSPEAGEELQSLYERRGLYDKALSVYDRLKGKGQATERSVLRACGALLSMNARESGLRDRAILSRAKQILQTHLGANPGSQDAQIAMGRLVLYDGDPVAAGRIADDILKKEPKNPQALVLKAQVFFAQRRFDEAKQILQPISTFYPNWLEIQYCLAIAQMETGYESMAQQTLRRLLRLNPQYFPARLRLAESLCKTGQVETAEAELRDAVTTSSSKDLILPTVVNVVRQYATPGRAAAMIDAALAAGPVTPRLLDIAAYQYWRLGKTAKAQECLTRAGTPGAESPTADLVRASHLIQMNQFVSAEAILTKLSANPAVAVEATVALARLKYKRGYGADARALLSDAMKTSAITVSQRLAVAEAYLEGDDLDGALESVRAVLATDEHSYSGQMLLGRILQRRGDAAGAKRAFATADRLLPTENADPARRAGLAMLRGDYERCAEVCETALRAADASPALRLIAAQALEQLGRFRDASAQLTAYARAEPASLEGYLGLARLYLRTGKPDEGLKALEPLGDTHPSIVRFAQSQILRATAGQTEAIAHLAPVVRGLAPDLSPESRREVATTLATWQAAVGQLDDAAKTFNWLGQGNEAATAAWGRFGLYINAGRPELARQELRQIERPMSPESMTRAEFERLAQAQLNVGETDAALATARAFGKAFSETDAPVRLTMEIQQRSGRPAEAIKTFEEAARSRKNSVDLLADGAALYTALCDYPRADEVLGQMSKCGPTGLLRAAVLRAEMLMRLGLNQAAVTGLTAFKDHQQGSSDVIQLTLGKALSRAGKPDESDAALRTVPSYSPQYAEALRTMAGNAHLRGKPRAAAAILKQALQHDRGDAEAAGAAARMYLSIDDVGSALAIAQAALRTANNPARYAQWTGVVAELQWLSGDVRAAEKTYRTLIGLGREGDVGRVQLGLLLLSQNRDGEAANVFGDVRAAGPMQELSRSLLLLAGAPVATTSPATSANARARKHACLRALALAARGDPEHARQLLATAPPTDLPRGDVERVAAGATNDAARRRVRRLAIGRAMLAAGVRDVALRWLRDLAKEWPSDAVVWQSLREALTATDRPAEAAQVADRLREQCGDSMIGQGLAADRALADRRYDEALKILTHIASTGGETSRLCIKRGDVLYKQGKPAEAIREYRRAFELDPTDAAALNDEAYALATSAKGDKAALDQAFELLRKAASLGPVSPAVLETKGWVQVLQGNTADGLRSLSQAIADLGTEPVAHYHIGAAYKSAGDPEWARLHLENALLLAPADLPEKRLAAELLNDLRRQGIQSTQRAKTR
jgi:tetratricopeptide (TPR) repeat protein